MPLKSETLFVVLPLNAAAELTGREAGQDGLNNPRAGAGRASKDGRRNTHPTVKPLALMAYLAKLIIPPHGGVVLDPFCGSGSSLVGAKRAGAGSVIGIDIESNYLDGIIYLTNHGPRVNLVSD